MTCGEQRNREANSAPARQHCNCRRARHPSPVTPAHQADAHSPISLRDRARRTWRRGPPQAGAAPKPSLEARAGRSADHQQGSVCGKMPELANAARFRFCWLLSPRSLRVQRPPPRGHGDAALTLTPPSAERPPPVVSRLHPVGSNCCRHEQRSARWQAGGFSGSGPGGRPPREQVGSPLRVCDAKAVSPSASLRSCREEVVIPSVGQPAPAAAAACIAHPPLGPTRLR